VFALPDDVLPSAVKERADVTSVELALERTGPEAGGVRLFRALTDLVRFLRPDLDHAHWPRTRALRRVLKLAGVEKSWAAARQASALQLPREVCERLGCMFRDVERLLPPQPELEEGVARVGVDALLVVTRCVLGGVDTDAVKVARRLGLPSIMVVWSWDNLSSKATLTEHPDWLLVWNEVQAREAVDQHGIPSERVLVVGAANFDRSFEEIAADGQAESPAPTGESATLLYLGSSPKVAPQEPLIVDRWLAAVRSSDEPLVREAHIIVRPHPAALARWQDWSPSDDRLQYLEPAAKSEPVRLSRLVREADAVVALNTSAEIDAAIAGRPVLTFRAGPEAPGQEGSAHFPYLLEQNGGFVLDAATLEEHIVRLAAVLRGEYDREQLRWVVQSFVRPAGIARPVVPMLVSAIVEFARARLATADVDAIRGEPASQTLAQR